MSTQPSKSQHLKLEGPADTRFEAPSDTVDARMIRIRKVAFDHAIHAGRPVADAADASQDVALRLLKMMRANPDFLRDEKELIKYTQEAATNWFRAQWSKGKRIEPNEEWIAAVIEIHREDGVDDPTPEELLAADEAARANDAERLRRIHKAIAKLPAEARKVFRERYVKQQKVAAVAEKLGKAEGTVRNQTYKSLIAIREALGVTAAENPPKEPQKTDSSQRNKPELMP